MKPIAEVIASSTSVFTAEVYSHARLPALGQWVSVKPTEGIEAYGIVSYVEMVPFDDARSAIALGKTEDELRREMPHVMELLRTVMRVQMVAYRTAEGAVRQTLPLYPPRIHSPVLACSTETIRQIGRPFDFLRVLLIGSEKPAFMDDLLVAVLSGMLEAHRGGDGHILVESGKVLSRLLKDDSERLQSILRRVA